MVPEYQGISRRKKLRINKGLLGKLPQSRRTVQTFFGKQFCNLFFKRQKLFDFFAFITVLHSFLSRFSRKWFAIYFFLLPELLHTCSAVHDIACRDVYLNYFLNLSKLWNNFFLAFFISFGFSLLCVPDSDQGLRDRSCGRHHVLQGLQRHLRHLKRGRLQPVHQAPSRHHAKAK